MQCSNPDAMAAARHRTCSNRMHERDEPHDGQPLRWWTTPQDRAPAAFSKARRSWHCASCLDCGTHRMVSVVVVDSVSGVASPKRIVVGVHAGLWGLWTIPTRGSYLHLSRVLVSSCLG